MPASVKPGLIVARDLEIVAWLDRLVGASVDQIRQRFGLGRTQAYRRLQVLQDHGLVRRRHLSAILPPLYTRREPLASHRQQPSTPMRSPSWSSRSRPRAGRSPTELELRRERSAQPALGAALTDEQLATVLACPRVPDAAELLASGGLRAFEVELSSKGRSRRAAVLAAYATSTYESVVWIAPDPPACDLINREVEERGLAGFHGGAPWDLMAQAKDQQFDEAIAMLIGALARRRACRLRLSAVARRVPRRCGGRRLSAGASTIAPTAATGAAVAGWSIAAGLALAGAYRSLRLTLGADVGAAAL